MCARCWERNCSKENRELTFCIGKRERCQLKNPSFCFVDVDVHFRTIRTWVQNYMRNIRDVSKCVWCITANLPSVEFRTTAKPILKDRFHFREGREVDCSWGIFPLFLLHRFANCAPEVGTFMRYMTVYSWTKSSTGLWFIYKSIPTKRIIKTNFYL